MTVYIYSSYIPLPPAKVFAWHEKSGSLEKLIPPGSRLKVVVQSERNVRVGSQVVLHIKFGPWHKRWVLVRTEYVKSSRFVERQAHGPFQSWEHKHQFSREGKGTRYVDRVEYELPWAAFTEWIFGSRVRRKLDAWFDYRHKVVATQLRGFKR